MRWIALAAVLTACSTPEMPGGCPVGLTELGRANSRACIAAYHEEQARQEGRAITKCYNTASGVTCIDG